MLDSPALQRVRSGAFAPTFEIQNNDALYPCDPEPAVDAAKLHFDGFEAARSLGRLCVHVKDDCNWMESVVDFIHGNPIVIDKANAYEVKQIAEALGIPLLADCASRVIFACRVYLDYCDENDDDELDVL